MTVRKKTIGIGLLGLGTVGTGVFNILKSQAAQIEKKTGVRLEIRKICVRSLKKHRAARASSKVITTRVDDILNDPAVDILVELIGGIHPAKEILLKAFAAGKHVVTANKALLAEEGKVIFLQAARHSRSLGFEASVCGGIPIIQAIREGLASNEISHFLGIVNGTCNSILSAMTQGSVNFETALRQAQEKGYAESDSRLDVDGIDSAHKLAVLARLAFRTEVDFRVIPVEGIRSLSALDIQYAKELGYVIKLLAIGKKTNSGLDLRVHPTMLPTDHPLANVWGVYNAVFLHADQAGDMLFYGRGAGMLPTASAVVGDMIEIAKKIHDGVSSESVFYEPPQKRKVLPIGETVSKYYLRFQVADKPGVLGRIAQTLGRNGISILSVHQKESHPTQSVPVVILTYQARESHLRAALRMIDAQKEVKEKTVVIRVEK
jgi:homoserine dehydrogenase